MKSGTSTLKDQSDSLSPSVRAEAAVWVARLHSSGRSRALEAGFRRWLTADPAHTEAFELATEAWDIGGSIPSGALPRIAHHSSSLSLRESMALFPSPFGRRAGDEGLFSHPRLALAAALSSVIIGTFLYLNHDKPAVSTDVGEQRMLTLEDGSRIFLNTDTRLFVQQDETRRHVQLDSGEALFDVVQDPQRPFIVTAGNREVVALGTAFVVKRDQHQLTVTLMEGKVAVSPKTTESPDASTVLIPGQRLTFTNDKPPTLDKPPLEKVTAWRRGEVILDKTRLGDAVNEMNRYSAIKLVVDDSEADIRVSGIFRAGDSARFAQAVAETYHLAVVHQDRQIVISESPR